VKEKKKLYVLIAPQCSGKSTWVKENISNIDDLHVVSTDDIITSMFPDLTYDEAFDKTMDKEVDKLVRKTMRDGFVDAIGKNKNIVIDRTNMTIRNRTYFLNSVGKKYEKIAVVFKWDKDTFLKRTEKRKREEGKTISLELWEKFCSIYEEPTIEEGFDKIIKL
jgi:predicted kinase